MDAITRTLGAAETANAAVNAAQNSGYVNTPPQPTPPVTDLLSKQLHIIGQKLITLNELQEGMISRLFGPRPENPGNKETTGGGGAIAEIERLLNAVDMLASKALDNQSFLGKLG